MPLPILTFPDQTAHLLRNTNQQQKAKYKMHKLTHMFERLTAIEEATKEGLRDITQIIEDWHDGACSFMIYGTMFDLDPDTYKDGRAPMMVRVTNGKIDLVDGV